MAFAIHANLDCESKWSGLGLSQAVLQRISLYGLLLSALAPDDQEVEVWTPVAIDPARWLGRPLTFRFGTPERADLRWAELDAKAANDRRLAHAVARELGVGLRGMRTITSMDQVGVPEERRMETGRHGDVWRGPWVAKVPWTAAGRDRVHGEGEPTAEQRTRLGRLLAACGALVVEPWCERLFDLGVCATVDPAGRVTAEQPHSLMVDARGGFIGIDLDVPPLDEDEREILDSAVKAAGAAIAKIGHVGPFAVDAFLYRDRHDERRNDEQHLLQPLCEINARYSFGWVARAFARRDGVTQLGFGTPPPGARILIAPVGAIDRVTAWIA